MEFIFNTNKISRERFFEIKEDELMFITSPGRMGDESGSTFIINHNGNYIVYRIDGWVYGDVNDKNYISFREMLNHFPKWAETLKNSTNPDYHGKYTYVYMGFGNGLAIDNRVYQKYQPYLQAEYEKQKAKSSYKDDSPSLYYVSWKTALERMLNNKDK